MMAASNPSTVAEDHHLLGDDVDIAHRVNVVRRTHPCQKLSHLVLTARAPWKHDDSHRGAYIYGTVLRDEQTGAFPMWYMGFPDWVLWIGGINGLFRACAGY